MRAFAKLSHLGRRWRGASIMQTTVTVGALAVLAGASAPTVQQYMNHARSLRAQKEVQIIGTAVVMLAQDLAQRGIPTAPGSREYLRLLVSGGDIPETEQGMEREWALPASDASVGRMEDYLVLNLPGFPEDTGRGEPGWYGPYLSKAVESDPWGNRYAAIVEWMVCGTHVPAVVSAGPDGVLSTPYRLTRELSSRRFGDDIAFLMH